MKPDAQMCRALIGSLIRKLKLEQGDNPIRKKEYILYGEAVVRALFALDEFEARKHSGLIAYFNKNYVSTGIFEKEYAKILSQAEWVRNKSDYRDFYIVFKDDAAEQIENAGKFIQRIEEYINGRLISSEATG